eukprot:Gb_07752 [translate_table: standard]
MCTITSPKSSNVQELGLTSPVGIFLNSDSAISRIFNPIASICGREKAVAMMKKRVQYTRGFTKRT